MLKPGGKLSGRYELVERIATGGMGDVWKAEDTVLGRTVAVKVLQPAALEEPGFSDRFRAEARIMATLDHPGVVRVYDYGEGELEGGGRAPYLVMEHVEGESLSRVLARVGRLAPHRVLDLVAQAADALQVAHDRGVIHRDVKPGNLLVRPNGTLVLTDFGIARSAQTGQLTQVGSVLGTAAYVSPEQASGSPVTPTSDVYSLGIVAYQALAGNRPFDGDNPIEVAMKHVRDPVPPLPPDVPPPARAVVERALAKDPAQRWPSAAAMAQAARMGALGTSAAPTSGSPAGTAVLPAAAGAGGQFSRGSAAVRPPAAEESTGYGYAGQPGGPGAPPKRGSGLVIALVAAIVVVLLAGVGIAWAVLANRDNGQAAPPPATTGAPAPTTPSRAPTASAPGNFVVVDESRYVGRDFGEVKDELEKLGLKVDGQKDSKPGFRKDQVTFVNPKGQVRRGSTVRVGVQDRDRAGTPSSGRPPFTSSPPTLGLPAGLGREA